MSLRHRILAAAGLLVALLIGLVVLEDRARASGQEVTLAMEAVDPRNLLTGHYVDLQLTQRLASGGCPAGLPDRGHPGWLALRKAGDRHAFTGAARTRAEAQKLGDVAVRGFTYCTKVAAPDGEADDAVTLEIGVDRFHADQDEALAIEAQLRARPGGQPLPAFVVVSVGDDGRARLKGLILDGKRTDLTWW